MPSTETPSHQQLFHEIAAFTKGGMFVGMPATVLSYNESAQTATVQPAISVRRRRPNSEELEVHAYKPFSDVPVVWPRGSGWSLHGTLVPGDRVALHVSDRSLDEWKQGAPSPITPQDIRRFDPSDVWAVPGLYPSNSPIGPSGVAAGAVVLQGNDIRLGSNLAQPLVLNAQLRTFLESLVAWLAAHVHADPASGVVSPPTAPPPAVSSFGTTKVKGE